MGRAKDKKTDGTSQARRRRFEPSSDARPRPVLTKVGEGRNKVKGREPLGDLVAARRAELGLLGDLVAARRAELGLTQEDLAVRMNVNEATVARIEEGQHESAETLRRLAKAFPPEEGEQVLLRSIQAELRGRSGTVLPIALAQVSRETARTPLGSLREPLRSLDGRWLRGGLAAAVLAAAAVIAAVIVTGESDDGGVTSLEPIELVAALPAAPVVVTPDKKPQKAKKAEKENNADRNAAPVTSTEESSAPTSSDSGSSSDTPESDPVSAPVATPPPAPSSGSSGSGSSNGPRPGIKHGINSGGP
jgi:transcriptional regulator with XRE-family HTH domain